VEHPFRRRWSGLRLNEGNLEDLEGLPNASILVAIDQQNCKSTFLYLSRVAAYGFSGLHIFSAQWLLEACAEENVRGLIPTPKYLRFGLPDLLKQSQQKQQ
ncbi:unnamed protein product, partial [Urochloa humidicola]